MNKAVIYCRVSSDKQAKNDTIASQEYECKKYAKSQSFQIVKTFKDEGVSGALEDRDGLKSMLLYLKKHQQQNSKIKVIAYDLSRLARDVVLYGNIIEYFESFGAELHFVTRKTVNTPEGRFMDNIEAAQAQYFREANRLKTIVGMTANMEMGYYVLNPPTGFKRIRDSKNHVYCARKEPDATVIQTALEKFSTGELFRQIDVQKFLENYQPYQRQFENLNNYFSMTTLFGSFLSIETSCHYPFFLFDFHRYLLWFHFQGSLFF